jgi:hypothetical protein
MDEEVWIPIVMFVSLAVVFSLWFYFRYKARLETQQTFRLALEKGSELSPDFIKQLAEPEPSKDRDLRRGLVWLALAVGLALCGFAVPDPTGDALRGCLAGAAFPFAIGVAFLIMYQYGARKA